MSEMEGYKNVKELVTEGEKLLKEGKDEYINAQIDENKMNIILFTIMVRKNIQLPTNSRKAFLKRAIIDRHPVRQV